MMSFNQKALYAGLADTRHIGDLWVDPVDEDIAVVAALGHVFGPNNERGLFRTEDGGKTWSQVLYVDDTTGAADLASSEDAPGILYASLWQVQRHPWLDYFQPTVGGNSNIYRSIDGGRNWLAVGGAGLPEGPMGRIELAVAPGRQAQRVWASVEAVEGGGVYRSEDGGNHWELVNDDSSLVGSYMGWLTPDPQDGDTVWAGGQPLRRSIDGGETFTIVRSSPGGDDYHALWIDPRDTRRMITGADQGAVVTFNGGDERDGDVPDPLDANIVYGAGLGGRVTKWDARTAQVQNVSPWPVSSYAENPRDVIYRFDWITPLAISAAPPHAMYTAAQVLFRSTDRGQSWQIISPDLSGAETGTEGCSADTPVDKATACGYGTLFAIAPSPLKDGLVWVLDSIAPLRHLAQTPMTTQPELVTPEQAIRLRFNQNKDTPLPPEEPTGENPPAGAVLDYILPADFSGPARLEILAADGSVVRNFDSEVIPAQPKARIYFAETWLGEPQALPATAGHHRFVWNLRYTPPPTLESHYSIAATPGKSTPIPPEGAFVLPGSYTVKLTAGGRTLVKTLDVTLDPRVDQSPEELASLLDFQRQVTEVLERAVALDGEINASNEEARTASMAGLPKKVAEALTALAIDLEHVDAPPTSSQRELLEYETRRFDQAENEWRGLR